MPQVRRPWSTIANDILADGEWHNMEDVLRRVAEYVPPGRAFRVGEKIRLSSRHGRPPKDTTAARVAGDHHRSIESGKHRLSMDCIYVLRRNGSLLERDVNGVHQVRVDTEKYQRVGSRWARISGMPMREWTVQTPDGTLKHSIEIVPSTNPGISARLRVMRDKQDRNTRYDFIDLDEEAAKWLSEALEEWLQNR